MLAAMQRLYTREQYMERIEWMRQAKRPIAMTSDIIVGFPGETEAGFRRDTRSARRSEVRFDLQLQVFAAPEHGGARTGRSDFRRRKDTAIMIVQERQRAIQMRQNAELLGEVEELLVESRYESTGQWAGPHHAKPESDVHSSATGSARGHVCSGACDARRSEALMGELVN